MEVRKQNIASFFSNEGRNYSTILIPKYQRRYSWKEEQVSILCGDLVSFYRSNINNNDSFFLGNIIYLDRQGTKEIIDGQQRITTLMLILKYLYAYFVGDLTNPQMIFYRTSIARCIWQLDSNLNPIEDHTVLRSEVFNSGFEQFTHIMNSAEVRNERGRDRYASNMRTIVECFRCFENNAEIIQFANFILNRVEFACIITGTLDNALDMFSSLNSKGMPLTDVDIFKAAIMGSLRTEEEQTNFSNDWNELASIMDRNGYKNGDASDAVFKDLFMTYQYYILSLDRRNDNPVSSDVEKMRRYFEREGNVKLINPHGTNVMTCLRQFLEFKIYVEKLLSIEGAQNFPDEYEYDEEFIACPGCLNDIEIKKLLNILSYSKAENAIRPVSIYYIQYKEQQNFRENFKRFLKAYIAKIVLAYLNDSSNDSIKDSLVPFSVEILKSPTPKFVKFEKARIDGVNEEIQNKPQKNVQMLLAIYSYYSAEGNNQQGVLPDKWQIEHIFPKKWKTIRHEAELNENADFQRNIEYDIELIGNKMPLEARLNNRAKNQFLPGKLNFYGESRIAVVSEMCNIGANEQEEWYSQNVSEKIRQRGGRIGNIIVGILRRWIEQYNQN